MLHICCIVYYSSLHNLVEYLCSMHYMYVLVLQRCCVTGVCGCDVSVCKMLPLILCLILWCYNNGTTCTGFTAMLCSWCVWLWWCFSMQNAATNVVFNLQMWHALHVCSGFILMPCIAGVCGCDAQNTATNIVFNFAIVICTTCMYMYVLVLRQCCVAAWCVFVMICFQHAKYCH